MEIGQLFALPIQSAIKAQDLAIRETISTIRELGLKDDEAIPFRIKTVRTIEERTTDNPSETPQTQFKRQPFEISVPLLALISPPTMNLQEVNVEFGMEITKLEAEEKDAETISTLNRVSLAPSKALFTPLGHSNPTTMKVNMKIVREVPEGLARLGDVLTDMLSGNSTTDEESSTNNGDTTSLDPASMTVDAIPGIGASIAGALRAKGILTVNDFLSATATPGGVRDTMTIRGISERRIKKWRENAKTLGG